MRVTLGTPGMVENSYDVAVIRPVNDPQSRGEREHHERHERQERHHVNQQANY